ncbi:MAG: MBL fold metallo-hydrolase [Candidatus Shapirobacteria bacterium]|nr:MBL fold metallo-hydrolase [Candidatus Shapirobacteria bacterium]MDD4410631.1 MBL fold metallo-hydrolase [Candidatus Shapirobacteria bacterium]
MLSYEKILIGELETNCYLIWEEETKECLVIDPGDDGVGISEEINNKKLKVKAVFLTHGHFDHSMGALDLKLIYNVDFGCSEKDAFLLDRQDETAKHFLKKEIQVPNFIKIDIDLDKIKKFELGEEIIEIIKTPGHTPGSVCFYNKKNKLLFSGDTLFAGLRGRTDFKYGSTKEIFKSLKKLMKLDKKTLVLPGHGDETTIERESRRYL